MVDTQSHRIAVNGRVAGRAVALRDVLLAVLSFSTGIYEAAAFLTFGKVFTAFQTGNLIFLGLGVAGTRPPAGPDPATVVTSLVAFAVGGAVSTAILRQREEGPAVTAAWSTRVTTALGVSLFAQVVFAAVWVGASNPSHRIGVLIALGAFAMAVQMNAVRSLAVPGISTTAFTATFILLAGLVVAHAGSAAAARRLAGALVALVGGALVGALLVGHYRSATPVVPLFVNAAVLATVSRWRGRLYGYPGVRSPEAG
jgi:uncharacterized membrane protein YoaK (UPF0700 family)